MWQEKLEVKDFPIQTEVRTSPVIVLSQTPIQVYSERQQISWLLAQKGKKK